MAEKIKADDVGAFLTEDNKTDGYYLVNWLGTPYTLQEKYVNNDFIPPIVMQAGQIVYKAKYFNPVPLGRVKNWYTSSDIEVLVSIVEVLSTGITMVPFSNENLPSVKCKKILNKMKGKNASRIDDNDLDQILDELGRREDLN